MHIFKANKHKKISSFLPVAILLVIEYCVFQTTKPFWNIYATQFPCQAEKSALCSNCYRQEGSGWILHCKHIAYLFVCCEYTHTFTCTRAHTHILGEYTPYWAGPKTYLRIIKKGTPQQAKRIRWVNCIQCLRRGLIGSYMSSLHPHTHTLAHTYIVYT